MASGLEIASIRLAFCCHSVVLPIRGREDAAVLRPHQQLHLLARRPVGFDAVDAPVEVDIDDVVAGVGDDLRDCLLGHAIQRRAIAIGEGWRREDSSRGGGGEIEGRFAHEIILQRGEGGMLRSAA
jgi:hypothetical protein